IMATQSIMAPQVIEVVIQDTGAGIPGEIMEKIFDPFFTTKPVGEGTGLGLSICHKIVEEHGGSIDVRSEPGKGAEFVIKIPAGLPDRTAGDTGRPQKIYHEGRQEAP
ncbi:MAG: ATP-binding protein, partial [Nitrospiraceae bacterium]|nr:ATP-binding protein [Nitrospiraceae bacterium]